MLLKGLAGGFTPMVRQDSPAGRFERNKKTQQELDRSRMLAQSQAERAKPKSKGKTLGGLKDLNE
ncbi:hypothetical protein [Synechococcus sp. CC9616]|uniref:hypothetical protein n=1 Tax=Synechococcus sp. CC9616 TaxID=110663 RepID=UPI0012EB1507|nr:hypothetical protein [Synechococcus sp. CC9616]